MTKVQLIAFVLKSVALYEIVNSTGLKELSIMILRFLNFYRHVEQIHSHNLKNTKRIRTLSKPLCHNQLSNTLKSVKKHVQNAESGFVDVSETKLSETDTEFGYTRKAPRNIVQLCNRNHQNGEKCSLIHKYNQNCSTSRDFLGRFVPISQKVENIRDYSVSEVSDPLDIKDSSSSEHSSNTKIINNEIQVSKTMENADLKMENEKSEESRENWNVYNDLSNSSDNLMTFKQGIH